MQVISILTVVWFVLHTVDCSCDLGSFGIHRFGPDCRFMCHCKNKEQCDDTTGECSSGCASFWYGPGCQYRDLAEGEFSRHSDNLDSPHLQYPNFANDGKSETCSYTAEVNSTEKRTNPFWRVWLPSTERISELMILTKVEKLNHFEGFEVYVENVTASERENNEFQRKDSQKCYRHTGDAPRNESIKVLCENSVVGNQIRIQLKTLRSQLVLCDVKINGGRNLAFDRNISQTKSIRHSKPASNAVDGHDKQSTWTECSYTTNVDNPFLKLDIGRNALIWFIRILPYKDIYRKIYETIRLQIADDKTSLIEKTVDIYEQTQSANITLNTAVARYVTITKQEEFKPLQICELKVFGDCLEDECGFDCSKTCHCKYTNIWDKMDGKCSSGCKYGWTGKSCDRRSDTEYQQSCGHCLDPNGCNLSTGECRTGCQDGYYPPDCKKECRSWKYGHNCVSECPSTCNDGVCDSVDGKCHLGCKPGFVGEKCEQKCQSGWYGQNCGDTCPSSCNDGVCDSVDGKCQSGCKPGYFGERCENKCKSGRYGQNCGDTCPSSCNDGVCDNVDGKCQSGCKPGYFGERCENNCSKGKYGQNCSLKCSDYCNYDGRCNNVDGTCVYGCKPGYSDRKCEQKCQSGKHGQNCLYTCSSSCNDGLCDSVDGKCQSGCKPGYVGETCETNCRKGKYGQNCTLKCSDNCNDGNCNNVDGRCMHGCKPGYSDRKCEQDNCNDGRCNNVDGTCMHGCKPGFVDGKCEQECHNRTYGQYCSYTCSKRCTDGLCDNVNGNCLYGCKPGYVGTKCEQKCEKSMYGERCGEACGYCLAGAPCDHENGACLDGCVAGYHGQLCKSRCLDGHWGPNCKSVCGYCINSSACSIYTGTCQGECKPGWLPPLCIYAESHVAKDCQSVIGTIIGPTVAVVATGAAIIILQLILKRRNSQKPENPVEVNNGTSAPDVNEYETVGPSRVDVEHETQYTELQAYKNGEETVVAAIE